MQAWVDLFSTDYGLMSAIVIAGVLVMSVYFSVLFKRKMEEAERNQGK